MKRIVVTALHNQTGKEHKFNFATTSPMSSIEKIIRGIEDVIKESYRTGGDSYLRVGSTIINVQDYSYVNVRCKRWFLF